MLNLRGSKSEEGCSRRQICSPQLAVGVDVAVASGHTAVGSSLFISEHLGRPRLAGRVGKLVRGWGLVLTQGMVAQAQ